MSKNKLKELQKINERIALLEDCLEQAMNYAKEHSETDSGKTSFIFPSYVIDGIVRDVDSIQEELRILEYVRPYL